MRKLRDWIISALDRWIDRELADAKRDPDVSYAEYKEMERMVSERRAEATQPEKKGLAS